MSLLSQDFPGILRQSPSGYPYYLPASLGDSQELPLSPLLARQIQSASLALGEFSSLIGRIPNPQLFILGYVTREAVLSSRIEGIQTSIEEAFREQESVAPEKRRDWAEVNAYIQAMNRALSLLQELPLGIRLIKQTHHQLLNQARGRDNQPGEFRNSQNWIGGSRPDNAHFVPPMHHHVPELMGDLEQFIQQQQLPLPELINAALLHYQFETIHPFLDGNGRLGRMLISLYLVEKRILKHPILCISAFFESHRKDYYAALDKARESETGVLQWVSFFLDAVEQAAKDGIHLTQELLSYDARLKNGVIPQFGRQAKNALLTLDRLYLQPVINAKQLQQSLGFSPQITHNLLSLFSRHEILNEVTGNKRNRLFVFHHFIDLLEGKYPATDPEETDAIVQYKNRECELKSA